MRYCSLKKMQQIDKDFLPLSYVAFFCSRTNVNRKHALLITDAAPFFKICVYLIVIGILLS